MSQVIQLAKLNGWLCFHPFDSRKSEPGFPDLVLIRGKRLLAVELKSATGQPTAEQSSWLDAFAAVEIVSARLWRPSNWNEIEEVLR